MGRAGAGSWSCFRVSNHVHGQWACYQRLSQVPRQMGLVTDKSTGGQGCFRVCSRTHPSQQACRHSLGPAFSEWPPGLGLHRGLMTSYLGPKAPTEALLSWMAANLFLWKDEGWGPLMPPSDLRHSSEMALVPALRCCGLLCVFRPVSAFIGISHYPPPSLRGQH